ncbi:Satratoxin biosynthesis SC1 cluster protein 4 [Pseudocercospora fuligena]|uniref:Satratoxin biosynthesis SC1 cluster protein 4 n=1 Tax=Pseudocercospora fuligena TaxID=685502 RepID=A0A8H6VKV8_9PEZI|nr:Satratoxin biosynthesis SC1 cluster protein 4 [Pseudocercospora fuligena]
MWPLSYIVVAILTATTHALDNLTDDQKAARQAKAVELLPTIPKCGLACLETVILASPCGVTDLDCTCPNATIVEQVTTLHLTHRPATKNVTDTMCGKPVRSRKNVVVNISIGGMVVVLLAYLARIASKLHITSNGLIFSELGWDDFAMTLSVLFAVPFFSMSRHFTRIGFGSDIWTLSYDHITKCLIFFFADELLYIAALSTVKIAVLLTYLRFFSARKFRQLVHIMIGVNVCYYLAFTLATIFQCKPVSLSWTRWDGEHKGKCVSFNGLGWSSAIVNIVIDLIVIGMPMPLLWNMRLGFRKKLMVMAMFGVGFFVTCISILRLHILVSYGKAANFTWVYVPLGYWFKLEMVAAIFCACMPAMRTLLRRMFPASMTGSSKGGDTTGATTGLSGHTLATDTYKSGDTEHFVPLKDISKFSDTKSEA